MAHLSKETPSGRKLEAFELKRELSRSNSNPMLASIGSKSSKNKGRANVAQLRNIFEKMNGLSNLVST